MVVLDKDDLRIKTDFQLDFKNQLEAYFLFDYKNKIQLVYPNFEQNLTRVEFTKLIQQKIGIEGRENYNKYKMIWYTDFRHKESHSKNQICKNYVQSHTHLKAALKWQGINEDTVFSFYRDEEDQILYITGHDSENDQKTKEIIQVQIKDVLCEEAYDEVEEETMEMFKHEFQRKMLILQNQSFESDNEHEELIQSKKSQTRIKMMTNYLLKKYRIKKNSEQYLSLCRDEDENDAIDCDINSKKLII